MGHLFVVQADLTKLVVGDVIVPCDRELNLHRGFQALFPDPVQPGTYMPELYCRPQAATKDVSGLWRVTDGGPGTRTWLFDSSATGADGEDNDSGIGGLVARIARAVEAIAAAHRAHHTNLANLSSHRPVIGLTLMGITEGGFQDRYSLVIEETLNRFESLCRDIDLDIVLALRNRADYAAVQHLRRRSGLPRDLDSSWEAGRREAKRLAARAAAGQLVLFIGSGASAGAGLRTWNRLLKKLAADVGLQVDDPAAMDQMDPRDQALLIAMAPKAHEVNLSERIAVAFSSERYPLDQALLASLRLEQALTTNYDVLYETAFAAGTGDGPALQVLPREPYRAGFPWLMKIHGDVRVPATIVLSRDDYIRFDAESIPMASVLQSAMLTSHILFVGYSVSDENVVRLARQVVAFRMRHNPATSPAGEPDPLAPSVGTVLVPEVNSVKSRLWQGILHFAPLPSATNPAPRSRSERNRDVAIFLDLLGMYACRDAPYLLADRYNDLLGPADRKVKTALQALQRSLPEASLQTPVTERVSLLLREFGSPTP